MEAVFSARSVSRLYNEDQLPLRESLETAVRRVEVGVRWPPACEDVKPGSRGSSTVESVTKQRREDLD
jgi:hypothetical protein